MNMDEEIGLNIEMEILCFSIYTRQEATQKQPTNYFM